MQATNLVGVRLGQPGDGAAGRTRVGELLGRTTPFGRLIDLDPNELALAQTEVRQARQMRVARRSEHDDLTARLHDAPQALDQEQHSSPTRRQIVAPLHSRRWLELLRDFAHSLTLTTLLHWPNETASPLHEPPGALAFSSAPSFALRPREFGPRFRRPAESPENIAHLPGRPQAPASA